MPHLPGLSWRPLNSRQWPGTPVVVQSELRQIAFTKHCSTFAEYIGITLVQKLLRDIFS